MYGTGTNVDQLISASAELTYNVPHWKIGASGSSLPKMMFAYLSTFFSSGCFCSEIHACGGIKNLDKKRIIT